MKKLYIFIIILLFLTFSCDKDRCSKELTQDDYILFNIVLDTLYASVKYDSILRNLKFDDDSNLIEFEDDKIPNRDKYFLIYDSTFHYYLPPNNGNPKGSIPGILDETANNFLKCNHRSYRIVGSLLATKYNFKMIKRKKRINWYEINNLYPNNKDKTQAIVDIGFLQSGLSGFGMLILFEKKNDKWIVTKKINTWIA